MSSFKSISEALRACTLRNKSTSNRVLQCLPLYQNLLALERAHGRLDSAKGICRRLLQGTTSQVELWQCLAALEESTGNPKQALVVLNDALMKCGYDWELAYTTARLYLEQVGCEMAM
jgi:predicted Zn-dependent protease